MVERAIVEDECVEVTGERSRGEGRYDKEDNIGHCRTEDGK
jgi:hypothetical protein